MPIKTRLFFILFFLFCFNGAYAQKTFYKTAKIANTDYNYAKDVVSTQDGGYVYLFYDINYIDYKTRVYLVKLDSLGSVEWSKVFGSISFDQADPFSIIEMQNGDFVIVGKLGFERTFVFCTDKDGNYKWVKKFNTFHLAEHKSIEAKAISTHDGGIAITGTGRLNQDKGVMYLLKMDSDGEVQWANIVETAFRSVGYDLVENENNEILVVGSTTNGWYNNNVIYGAKFNQQGQNIWAKEFGEGFMPSIALASKDEYIISAVGKDNEGFVFNITDQGGVQWGKKLSAFEQRIHLKQASRPNDYRLVYGGYAIRKSMSTAFQSRAMACEISSAGEIIWAKKYGVVDLGGLGVNGADLYLRLAVAPDGGYILTGNDQYFYDGEMYMIKTDSEGDAGCNSLDDYTFQTSDLTIKAGNSISTKPMVTIIEIDSFNTVTNSIALNTICIFVSTNEFVNEELVRIFPNPANDFITVQTEEFKNKNLSIKIYNALGIQYHEYEFYHGHVSTIDVSSLLPGQYFYELRDKQNIIKRGILMVIR